VIATASNKEVATVPVEAGPTAVAATPDGTHAYVANASASTVSVIAIATNKVVATVPVGLEPAGIGIMPP
jgi:YVTN family beta-propeller protein